MTSSIPGDPSLKARLASVVPDDIKSLSQLMQDVKYADVGTSDGSPAGNQLLGNEGVNEKQLKARTANLMRDWLKKHPGSSPSDFEQALASGSLQSGENGGLSSDQQKDLFGMIQAHPDLLPIL